MSDIFVIVFIKLWQNLITNISLRSVKMSYLFKSLKYVKVSIIGFLLSKYKMSTSTIILSITSEEREFYRLNPKTFTFMTHELDVSV